MRVLRNTPRGKRAPHDAPCGNCARTASLGLAIGNARIPATLAGFGLARRSRLRSQLCFAIDSRCSSTALFCVPLPVLSPFQKILRNAFRKIAQPEKPRSRKSRNPNEIAQCTSLNRATEKPGGRRCAQSKRNRRTRFANSCSRNHATENARPKADSRNYATENARLKTGSRNRIAENTRLENARN